MRIAGQKQIKKCNFDLLGGETVEAGGMIWMMQNML